MERGQGRTARLPARVAVKAFVREAEMGVEPFGLMPLTTLVMRCDLCLPATPPPFPTSPHNGAGVKISIQRR